GSATGAKSICRRARARGPQSDRNGGRSMEQGSLRAARNGYPAIFVGFRRRFPSTVVARRPSAPPPLGPLPPPPPGANGSPVFPPEGSAIVAKPELGIKRLCGSCGAKFYDLNKDPIVCPKCSTVFVVAPAARARAEAVRAPVAEEEAAAPEMAEAEFV